jgi:hypothetical protein
MDRNCIAAGMSNARSWRLVRRSPCSTAGKARPLAAVILEYALAAIPVLLLGHPGPLEQQIHALEVVENKVG